MTLKLHISSRVFKTVSSNTCAQVPKAADMLPILSVYLTCSQGRARIQEKPRNRKTKKEALLSNAVAIMSYRAAATSPSRSDILAHKYCNEVTYVVRLYCSKKALTRLPSAVESMARVDRPPRERGLTAAAPVYFHWHLLPSTRRCCLNAKRGSGTHASCSLSA